MLGRVLLAAVSTGVLLVTALPQGSAAAASYRADQEVRFLGYSFSVPATWRVISLAGHRQTCVRFDRHVVYLGVPSPNQSCPSLLVGTTESMLIEPGPRRAGFRSAEDMVTRRISVTGRGMRVTATFGTRPAVITRILASAGLPRPVTGRARAAATGRRAGQGLATESSGHMLDVPAAAPLPSQATDFQGQGFDTCAAPSEAAMQAWGKSPYRAVGVYIGGSDAACAQPNLTAGWLRHEAAAGWHFFPLYVGPQAAFGELGSSAARQGAAAAADAAHQAERLGFGPLTPIYYDMEAYLPVDSARALAFESAWTTTLHQLGYSSGVYSSSSSGIADLVHQFGRGKYVMPNVIDDALWNGQANAVDAVFGPGQWRPHMRIHQYSGNVVQTHGGVTIQIDQDYVNVLLPGQPSTPTPTVAQAVTRADGARKVFYRGPDGGLWYLQRRPGQGWARPADLGGSLYCQPSAVISPTGHITVFYRGADQMIWQLSSTASGWSPAHALPALGNVGGRPWAVSEASGVIDVFWRNFSDSSLWYAEDTPGQGWSSPVRLASGLTSAPSPAVSSPGVVQVFWKGADRNLWQATRDKAGRWSSPGRVGMGLLKGWPHATGQPDGDVQVFWRHGTKLLGAFRTPNSPWSGPFSLGHEPAQSPPVPVMANGRVHVLFIGGNGGLWQSVRTKAGQWRKPAQLLRGPLAGMHGPLAAVPFAATDPGQAGIDVFWRGRAQSLWWRPGLQLWWTAVSSSGRASTPRDLAPAGHSQSAAAAHGMIFGANHATVATFADETKGVTAQRRYLRAGDFTWPSHIPAGLVPVVSFKPNLSETVSGALDSQILSLLQQAPSDSWVTIFHEANLKHRNIDPALYTQAVQHVAALIQANNLPVHFGQIFATYPVEFQGQNLAEWMVPGLDFYGLDGYQGSCSCRTADDVFAAAVNQLDTVEPGAPVAITETNTNVAGPAAVDAWAQQTFALAAAHQMTGYLWFARSNATANRSPSPPVLQAMARAAPQS